MTANRSPPADVKCTWDLIAGNAPEKFRVNPRKSWYRNLEAVIGRRRSSGHFHLKRPQPSFIALLASGWSPVYPCHVPPREMRLQPIGTGPFKFVEFKPNESIKVVRNPDYWKTGPALSRRDRIHVHGQPLDRDPGLCRRQFRPVCAGHPVAPTDEAAQGTGAAMRSARWCRGTSRASCSSTATSRPSTIPNCAAPMALTLDRKAFIDIISDGEGSIGGAMMPPPAGSWGMPPEVLQTLPGYGPDVEEEPRRGPRDHEEARLRAGQAAAGRR